MKFIIYKTSDFFRPAEEPIKGCDKGYVENEIGIILKKLILLKNEL